jgi:ABC-type nitrate/sulfonate/bicarbonate transport system substrate-binding protein
VHRRAGRSRVKYLGVPAAIVAGALLVASCSSSAKSSGNGGGSGSSSADGGGSTASISIAGSFGADFGLAEIADQAGFFKQQGLNVKLVNSGGFSAANLQSAFLAGTYTFEIGAAASQMLAVAAGGQFKAVMGIDIGQQTQIAIAPDVAKKFHIPSAGSTPAETTAQIMALKGTKITIGVSNTSSPGYNQIVACFAALGLDAKNGTDVVMKPLGNTSTLAPALAAGKIDAFTLPPPISDVKGATIINIGNIEPLHSATGLYMMALNKTITGQAPVVQKTINAMVQAWQYAKDNPDKAQPMLAAMYEANGIKSTDDPEAKIVYQDDAKYWVTPDMPQSSFANALKILEVGQGKTIKLTYDQMIEDSFVKKAISDLKISVPTIQ